MLAKHKLVLVISNIVGDKLIVGVGGKIWVGICEESRWALGTKVDKRFVSNNWLNLQR